MDWTDGYAATWRVDRIDPATWEPCDTLLGVGSIEVDRDATDEAPLLEAATMRVTSAATEAFVPGWHRVTMEATQGFSGESVAVSTVWLDVDGSAYDKGRREDTLLGRSVLHQAADAQIGDGQFAPKGVDGAAWAAERLAECIDAPVVAEGGFALPDHIVFDLGASVLEAVWTVLRAGAHCIQVDGRGEVHVLPEPTAAALSLDRAGACILQPKVSGKAGERTYTREWADGVYPLSVVYGAMPERGLDGLYRVTSQKLTCDKGITVEETVEAL